LAAHHLKDRGGKGTTGN